jgi:hypothetical protein
MNNTVTITFEGTVFIACLKRKYKLYRWWILDRWIGPVFRSRSDAESFVGELEKVTVERVVTDAYRDAPFQEDLIARDGKTYPVEIGVPSRRYAKLSDYPHKPVQVFEYKFHLPGKEQS